jgi:hypothetical protein
MTHPNIKHIWMMFADRGCVVSTDSGAILRCNHRRFGRSFERARANTTAQAGCGHRCVRYRLSVQLSEPSVRQHRSLHAARDPLYSSGCESTCASFEASEPPCSTSLTARHAIHPKPPGSGASLAAAGLSPVSAPRAGPVPSASPAPAFFQPFICAAVLRYFTMLQALGAGRARGARGRGPPLRGEEPRPSERLEVKLMRKLAAAQLRGGGATAVRAP